MTKTKNTKRALLMSALALFTCFAMLIGSTYAWFTDSVTSAGNTIQSGTLNVDLVDKEGNSLEGKVLKFVDQDDNDLWEPGCTYNLQEVYVANKGNLALKYEIAINGITGDAKLLEAIEWTVTVDGTTTELADLKGHLLKGETSKAIVLSGHMKEEAGNVYQGLTVEGISISVFATQYTHESDSFDNQYDKDAIYYNSLVTNANELYDAVATASENTVIAIDGNIVLTKALSKSGLKSIKFVAMNESATIDQAKYNMHFAGAKVSFEGLTLTHGEKTYGNGGQTSTAFAVWDAKEVNYIDCTFNRSVGTLHAALHNFIGCTFNGVENPGNTKSEYPLYICDGQDYNVIDCVFNCTNRGAILFYNDSGSGVDTLNISNTSFLGDIIDDKTAVEIHNNSKTQVYNVNIKNVVVGKGIVNGLYRIKPANVGEVNVTVDGQYVTLEDNTVLFKADEDNVVLYDVSDVATTNYTIPEGVTELRNAVFSQNTDITNVTIPAGITDFGASGVSETNASGGAFKDSGVTTVILEEGITEIPAAAFNGAKNLTSVNIPASVRTIGVNAFRSTAITELTVPATVTTISYGAFRDMTSLATVTLEGNHVDVPNYAFRGCTNLRTVYLNAETATIGTNMAFTNATSNNPNTNNITFYVKNETVANLVKASIGKGSYVAIYVGENLYAEIK